MLGPAVAARYLTVVPVPGGAADGLADVGRSAVWFPVVGLGIGVVLIVIDRVTSFLFPPLLGALLTVTAWKLVTGGLHLDGLADCFDALVGHDPAHRLAIMHDSRIGAFGAIGLILFLFLEIASLSEIPSPARWRTLLVTPALARATSPVLARLFPPARAHGHGAAFRAGLTRRAPPIAIVIAVVVAVGVLGALGIVTVAVALGVTIGLAAFLARRLGGITGDVLGAATEIAELATLLTVSAWVHLRP